MSDNAFQFGESEPCRGPEWFDRLATWCGVRRWELLCMAGAFQIAVLAAMTAIHATPYVVGETICLRVKPVDPRDLFRGDYVILRYDINRVPPEGIEGIHDSKPSDRYNYRSRAPEEQTVYVRLEPDADGKCWHGVGVSAHRPTSGKYIRGVYRRRHYGSSSLHFGIEAFYVPEGAGRDYEDAARKHSLTAQIVLTSWGQAKLRSLEIEK